MKRIISLLTIVLFTQIVFGQSNKKVQKAIDLFNDGKMGKAIEMMEKIKDKDPSDANWNVLVNMYSHQYEYYRQNSTKLLTDQLMESLNSKKKKKVIYFTDPKSYFNIFINKCREANLFSQSSLASQYLRNYLVDYNPDTAIADTAKEEFKTAEDFFYKKDYLNAISHYEKALSLQPDYYKAVIYLGDCYWYIENMDTAIYYFKKGIQMHPDLLEPRKYLTDALAFCYKNEEAKNECLNAIYIYPDIAMFAKYAELVDRDKKSFNNHWIKRNCGINRITMVEYPTKDKTWKAYQEAEKDVKDYCDSLGIITKPNTVTKSKYLEVYSWEHMLKETKPLPEEFAFAKKMADEGFLDCYVFISEFHYDFYDQYLDFVKNNKDKIKKYIETYLVE